MPLISQEPDTVIRSKCLNDSSELFPLHKTPLSADPQICLSGLQEGWTDPWGGVNKIRAEIDFKFKGGLEANGFHPIKQIMKRGF